VIPHGSSVYSYHFVITRHNSPVRRVPDDASGADRGGADVPPAADRRAGARERRLRASALDKPGFGVELNRDIADAPPLHALKPRDP
jgi:L-rhamnonate dehydratase